MRIIDISRLFNQGRKNEYTFNPSILHLRDNLFLVCYRTIIYDLAFAIHPWGAWEYNVFKNPAKAASAKYRLWMGPSIKQHLPQKTYLQSITDGENDSTSLALVSFKDDEFTLIWNIGQLF